MQETIKLKILDEAGHTYMTCDAGRRVSLVYTNAYVPGDRIALELNNPGQYCFVQFDDTMPEALVFVTRREINFRIPFGEQAITYSPKSFTGARHVVRTRLAEPEELALRRNLAFNPYDAHGDTGFFPLESPKTAEWFVLKNLIQAEGPSPFPALTQIEAWGREADADQ